MSKLEFITTGNEILSGLTVDTNFSWAAAKFSSSGLIPSYHVSVLDDADDIEKAYKTAAERSSFVIVTGGLGPTSDDLAVETSAEFFGTGLFFDKDSYDSIEEKLRQRGRSILEIHRKQALFPEGSEIIKNSVGTSNGYKFVYKGCSFYFLPGVPREFKSMIEGFVLPDITKTAGAGKHVVQKIIKTIGLGESEVAEKLEGLDFDDCDFSYRIKYPEIHLKLVARTDSQEEVDKIIGNHTANIKERLNNFVFTANDENLENVAAEMFVKNNLTISTAESCTGGLLANLLTDISGSSAYFLRGVVSYTDKSKTDLLGVEENLFKKVGAVSNEVVEQMAKGIRKLSGSNIGVGISGIAGPGGGSEDKPVGTVYIGVDYMDRVYSSRFSFHGSRKEIKLASAKYALDIVRNLILKNQNN